MPAKKNPVVSEEVEVDGPHADYPPNPAVMLDLLKWVGRTIVTRNANGRQSDKFCALCAKSKLHKEPCRHQDIWRLAGVNK